MSAVFVVKVQDHESESVVTRHYGLADEGSNAASTETYESEAWEMPDMVYVPAGCDLQYEIATVAVPDVPIPSET